MALIYFFFSNGPELAKGIHSDINPLTYVKNINNSIAIFDVSCEEVRIIIHSLKNSSAGRDEFSTFVGKLCVDCENFGRENNPRINRTTDMKLYRVVNSSRQLFAENRCVSFRT